MALDPESANALGMFVKLLTAPPSNLPDAAIADMRASERKLDRTRTRAGLVAVGLWAALIAFVQPVLGIVNMTEFAIMLGTIVVAFVLSVVRLKRPRPDGFIPTYLVIAIAAGIAGFNIGFSPNFIAPMFGILFTIAATLSIDTPRRYLPVITGAIAFTLPVVLERLGVVSPSMVQQGELLCLVPRSIRLLDPGGIGSTAANVTCLVLGARYTMRLREALTDE